MTIKEAFSSSDKKRILSIDGGGMRGVIPIAMLMELEDQTGKPAYELFDMVAGTSVGSVIAAGFALKMSAYDIMDIAFRSALPKAFGDTGITSWIRFALNGFKYRFEIQHFIDIFKQYSHIKISDIEHIGIFLTTKDIRTGNTYFITNRGPGADAFSEWTLGGAVASSAAAPIYFSPIAGNFIDGGVGSHGNPCFAVATEALQYIGESDGYVDDNVVLYSLGTGYHTQNREDGVARNWWILDWVQYIIGEVLDDSSLQAVYATRNAYGSRIDFRRYNPYLHSSALADLDILSGDVLLSDLHLDSTGKAEIDLMEKIGRAYAKHIDWSKPDVMAWDTVGGHPQPEIKSDIDWQIELKRR